MTGHRFWTFLSLLSLPQRNASIFLALIKVARALSTEPSTEKRIELLLRTATQHVAAERGLLVIQKAKEHWFEDEGAVARGRLSALRVKKKLTSLDIPGAIFQCVTRTHQSVTSSDASIQNLFTSDPYMSRDGPETLLCVPLLRQNNLLGALYLENKRVSQRVTPERLAVLELLASNAAISFQHDARSSKLTHVNAELKRQITERR